MCSPLAALSPMAALIKDKPRIATALISPAAAAFGVGKKKDVRRGPYDTPGIGDDVERRRAGSL